MSVLRMKARLLFVVLFAAHVLVAAPSAFAGDFIYRLDNGMEVILKENHSSPMVASIVFVKSGSKYESRFENGVTHFLEHLLFDGTVNLSREELDRSIRDLGGYINAFPRKELTAYLVLLPRQYIEYGLTVQADMLFNSTFPEDELAKERKVVIEEINRDADSPGAPAERFFVERAYAGTEYSRPVLGYRPFIENIPREAVIDYWKRYYLPENMIILVIGDFDPEQMKKNIDNTFGSIADTSVAGVSSDSTGRPRPHAELASVSRRQTSLTDQLVYDTVANVTSTYVNFSFEAPHVDDTDYLSVDLLSHYLAMDDVSPLMLALKGGDNPLASEVSVYLVPFEEFSRLEVSVIADNPDNREEIVSKVLEQLAGMGSHSADPEAIEGIKISNKCQEIYNSERLHHYSFMIAPLMMSAGWDFIQSYAERLGDVEWSDCRRAAQRWFAEPNYVATVVRPVGESGQAPYRPEGLSAEEVVSYFDTTGFAGYRLDEGYPLTYPSTDSVDLGTIDKAQYHREILPNGMTVIIKSNPDTRVFAMNVTGKNRSANEPDDKAGITDFVNRCLEKGTLTRDASELARDLSKIGANVTLYDNPWIPYDDRYTTRRFSFMRFETIDEFAEKGFHLFCEIILYPAFDSMEVENVRRSMLAVLRRGSASPSRVARDLFYETLFAGKAYSKPIMGTPRTIASIALDDLKAHHASFYSPRNMILSIVSNRSVGEVMDWVSLRFGRLSGPESVLRQAEGPEPVLEIRESHSELDKEQINIYAGSPLPGAGHGDAAAIKVATTILSNRLYLTLREKQGLAYSVGAGSTFDKEFGWFYTVIGTAAENYQKALDGIMLQMDKLKLDGPSDAEIKRAKNQLRGRLMRAKLSSINQAHYLGVDEYLGRDVAYDRRFLQELSKVTRESVRRVASSYLRNDAYILATAGKRP